MIHLDNINKIYFIGIGGIAMSAAAGMAKDFGFEVSGSDGKNIYAPAKTVLDNCEISYHIGYAENQPKDFNADLYILSAGEGLANPEVRFVVDQDLPRASFAELLYELHKDHLRIVVAGTHGKSTTTGFIGHILKNLDNSSFVAGAVLQNYKSNFYKGDGNYFVVEGDEYKSQFDDPTPKFQYYHPDVLVLTSLEFDHPDMFENFGQLENEFRELIAVMPEDGLIVYNADDVNVTKLVHESNVSSASFGIQNEADYRAENIQYGEYTTIEVMNKFSKNISAHALGYTEQYRIQLPGMINAYNALAAIAMARALGFQQDQIALELLSYQGVKRRFEVVGTKNGITVVDDYAHHPTAVRETLAAARLKYQGRKIWAVFEPHTFSRTKATLPDLVKSFDSADHVLISEIYAAREEARDATITSQEVVDAIKTVIGTDKVRLVHSKQEAMDLLKFETEPGDVVVIMAVGNFNTLAYELIEKM